MNPVMLYFRLIRVALQSRLQYRADFLTGIIGVMVLNVEGQRQRAHPLSTVQQPYLVALRVPATSFTAPQSG